MRKIQKNKGITLIALVITIIIMLIIVAVTISLTVRGNLFEYAGDATSKTIEAKEYEQLDIVKMAWKVESETNNDAQIEVFLENEKNIGSIDDYTDLGGGHYTIQKNGYERPIAGEYYFYIYHSSDNTVETIKQKADTTFNIYSKSKKGRLYGGYYSDYAGKGSYTGDGVEIKDGTEIAYNGMNVAWEVGKIYYEDGKAMHPEEGATYYIKEVPTYYLNLYNHNTKTGKQIVNMYFLAGLDDYYYSEAGFLVNTKDNKEVGGVVPSLTVSTGTSSVMLKANTVFRRQGITEGGYLSWKELTDYLEINGTMKICAYWITADGVLVSGTDIRLYEFNDGTTTNVRYTNLDKF